MAPPWMATVETSPAAFTMAAFSSVPTNTAVSPRKNSEVAGMPTGNARTWSVTEAIEGPSPGSNCSSRGDTAFKTVADHLLRQFAADEDDALSRGSPSFHLRLMIAFQHHVHALGTRSGRHRR